MRSEADILSVLFSWRCENCWRLDKPRCSECCLPILDKVSTDWSLVRLQTWLTSLLSWPDADSDGANLPPRLLCVQPVRGVAGGDRVPPDWRGGAVRDVPRLLREVSETVRQRGEGEPD